MKIRMVVFGGMRLYNTYYLCKEYIDDIKELEYKTIITGSSYELQNWENCKKGMTVIRQIPFLKWYVDDFYESVPVFTREDENPKIDSDTRNRLISKQKSLIKKMETVIELYESLDIGANENGIDVKIPSCDSLKEYTAYLKELDFVFSQCPFLRHSEGEIKFRTVDVGSQWLTFLIAATAGTAAVSYILNNLAILVDKAVQVKSHLLSLKQQEEILRSQKLQNDILETSVESFKLLKSHYLSEAVKEIENMNEESRLENGEERGKAEKSLEKLCDLLDKGVEIYASIDADRQIQMLFPALGGNVELPDNILKLLEDKKEG